LAERNRTFSLQTDLLLRPIRIRENTLSEHVNYAPGQSPGHRPLHICRVSRISVPYMLGKCECWSLPARTPSSLQPSLQCTIGSLFVGPAQRSPLIITGDAANVYVPPASSDISDPSYNRKITGIVVQIKSFMAQERFYIVTLFAIGTNLRITGF